MRCYIRNKNLFCALFCHIMPNEIDNKLNKKDQSDDIEICFSSNVQWKNVEANCNDKCNKNIKYTT